MALTPEQWRQTYTALWQGFDPTSFTLLVQVHLDQRLYDIAEEGIFPAVVAQVLDWCEEQGRVRDLIQGAAADNPTFYPITQLSREAQLPAWDFSPRPQRRVDSARPIPLERPARVLHFTGREQELGDLIARLQPGAVVTLSGPGGIGKTALASQAIWALAPGDDPPATFPGGVIFYTFYGRPSVLGAMEHIADVCGVEKGRAPHDRAQRALAGRTALLLLDGAEQADDLNALLDLRGNCCALVTTRVHGGTDVEPLPVDEAAALLRAWAGKQASAGAEADTAITRICELVGWLPLAVRLVGAYMAKRALRVQEYMKRLEQSPLKALNQGRRQRDSVPVLLERSVSALDTRTQQALGVVGLLALQPFEAEWVGAALGMEADETVDVLGELVEYSLVQRADDDSYTVTHALIHRYARERLAPDAETVTRLAEFVAGRVEELWVANKRDLAMLRRLRPHAVSFTDKCVDCEAWECANRLATALSNYLMVQGFRTDLTQVLSQGVAAARVLNEPYAEERHLIGLGNTFRRLGRMPDAIECFQRALIVARKIGDQRSEGTILGGLGTAYAYQGRERDAVEAYERAITLARETGDRRSEGIRLGHLGNVLRNLDRPEEAIPFYKQALMIAEERGDQLGKRIQLGNVGIAYVYLDQGQVAIDYLEKSLAIAKDTNDRQGEVTCLVNLGIAYRRIGWTKDAIYTLERALAISRDIGDRRGEGNCLSHLGLAYAAVSQFKKALDYYEQAISIDRETGDRRGESADLGNLGLVYRDLGRVEEAIRAFEQALVISRDIGDRRGEANRLDKLGTIYERMGGVDDARRCWEEALRIFTEIKSPNTEQVRSWLAGLDEQGPSA